MLTGESLPVSKHCRALPADTLLAERSNMAYAGTRWWPGRAAGWSSPPAMPPKPGASPA
jgi:cation-transporting ATPase F